ncbi:unnamed protein product [Sphagnum troendelagicum]|uniref:Uncharacterized protein n=1 Tax=Sphagnum troendelagicum TaxID=128251 RepID=A0ABP0URA9_9BRYO
MVVAYSRAKDVAKTKVVEKTHAMKLFVKDPNDDQMYNVTINNAMRYELVMDHVSIRMSFRQVVATIQHTKDRAKVAKLTGINDLIVRQYVRVDIGVVLQRIVDVDLLDDNTVWAFSLACDGSCRNPSFGLATKAKGLQGCGPRGSRKSH